MEKANSGLAVPAVAGLAAGVAFVIMFSLFAGPSSAGSSTVTEDPERVSLAIGGLQGAYKAGEPIAFSVKAKGVSDNACNRPSPSVVVRDSNGETLYWPHPFGFSTAMMCAGPEPLDNTWTFGDDAGDEIMLKPGSYTVFAAYEGVKVEKKFSVQ